MILILATRLENPTCFCELAGDESCQALCSPEGQQELGFCVLQTPTDWQEKS